MSGPAQAGLFLYAVNLTKVAAFYESLLDMRRLHSVADIVVLQSSDVQLVVHAIPSHIAATISIAEPPQHREDCALKFFFTVPSIEAARANARVLGGEVLEQQWSGPGFRVCNAIDPEGNIFQVRENVA